MFLHFVSVIFMALGGTIWAQAVPNPPQPEQITIVELPLPPVIPSNATGACTPAINPSQTGCIAQNFSSFQSGDFTPDGQHVIVNLLYVGAPSAPDPASIYSGEHVILVKADNSSFPNGDPWKCLSCGVPPENAQSLRPERNYPHPFRDGLRAVWGSNILDCGGVPLVSDECTPERTHIYPIHWNTAIDGSGSGGTPRELRLHPDQVHLGWSSFTAGGQFAYFGRLEFNLAPTVGEPLVPRYDLVDVNLLVQPNSTADVSATGDELHINDRAITIGELRGFSGTGDEILYIGFPREANNIDLFAVHIITGAVRRLTSHPEYADPIGFSADDQWFVIQDTRGSNRSMWMSGMRGIPPVIDLITTSVASSIRNNGPRRFFQPILIDRYGDRGSYYGQRINDAGDESPGSINDPNWNGMADPGFSLDGTKITYWQSLVRPPSCGGANPLPCPVSTAQGRRTYRVMLACLTSRSPQALPPAFPVGDTIPWATPFPPGSVLTERNLIEPGNYTLHGQASGIAEVGIQGDPSGVIPIKTIYVAYHNYSDDGVHIINGWEQVTRTIMPPDVWLEKLDWWSDLVETGVVNATKLTSPEGFHLQIDVMMNEFQANGTLTTTIDGLQYHQPVNGT